MPEFISLFSSVFRNFEQIHMFSGGLKVPSIFFIDMYKNQIDEFKAMIPERHTISPMIRTRITKINNQMLSTYEKNQTISDSHFLYREQNLSSRKDLYDTETILEGTWYKNDPKTIEISIERRFAKRLKLKLNDTTV